MVGRTSEKERRDYEASGGRWGWTAGVGLGAGFVAGMTAVGLRDSRQASGGFINWHIVP